MTMDNTIVVQVNGSPQEVPAASSLAAVLDALGIARDGVAVALDARVIPRGEYATTVVEKGDRLEILRAVGGG